jgi:hypothetical protein
MAADGEQAGQDPEGVGVPVLNWLGLQVGRTAVAAARVKLRRWSVPRELDSPMTGLRTDGYALLPRLLTPATVSELADVAARINQREDVAHFETELAGHHVDGTWRHDVPDDEREVLDQFWLHPTVTALLAAAERIRLEPGAGRCTIQRLVPHGAEPGGAAQVRSDTTRAAHQVWLYLSDVGEGDGPLVYYPGSQVLSPRLLRRIYGASASGGGASRTIGEKEIVRRHLEPKVFTGRRGTAVVANTFGYHGWLPGRPPGEQLVLQVEIRPPRMRRPRALGADASSAAQTGTGTELGSAAAAPAEVVADAVDVEA